MANNKSNNLNAKPSFVSAPPKPQKKEAKPISISEGIQKVMPWVYAVLFAVLAAYYLIGQNSDMLFMAQGRNLFVNDASYFKDCMMIPGGFLHWIGTYFTQYFYTPAVGAGILIAIWIATFAATKYAFNMKGAWTILAIIPLVSLLCSDIFTGYWVYYLKQPGYFFSTSIGFLMVMIATLIGRIIPEKARLVWIAVWAVGGYCLFGWLSLVGIIYMCANSILRSEASRNSKIICAGLSLALIIIVPLAFHYHYTRIRLEDAWIAAFPIFWAGDFNVISKTLPFIITALVPLCFPFFTRKKEENGIKGMEAWGAIIATCAVICGSVYATDKLNFDDYNYHAEMRMYRAIDEQRWNDVLTEMAQLPGDATRQMVLFKNIALLNTGHLGDALFRYNNFSRLPFVDDSLQVHMVQTAAPLIYYNHGKINFSTRWCIENSVEFGYKINDLQNLTRCAIINEEWDVAAKYLDVLKKTTFYKEWAEKYDPLIKDHSLMSKYTEFDNIKELYNHMGSTLDGDNGLCEMYLLNYFSNTMNKDSKLLQELTLAYALIQKDIQLFWPRFFLYANLHKGEDMPIHYQEAAYLYGMLEPQTVDVRNMPFDKEKVIDRYSSFQTVSQKIMSEQRSMTGDVDTQKVGELMKASFGDSFFWFYFFCRDVKSY